MKIGINTKYTKKNMSKQFSILFWFYIIFLILLLTLSIILIYKYKKKYIYRIVKKCSKIGIPHPKEIGWVKWNKIVTNNVEYETIFLKYFMIIGIYPLMIN